MDVCLVFSLDLERASQAELDAAWLALGEHKLRLRRLCFEKRTPVALPKLLPELSRCNARITEIWDETLKRQINSWYYGKPASARTGPLPEWDKHYNFMRWQGLPSVFEGWRGL